MIIKFNKNLYHRAALGKSVEAFKNLADFKIKENRNYLETTVKNINRNFRRILKDEFSNFVLAETKNGFSSRQNQRQR